MVVISYLEVPDQGHAWVVALCACVVNGILSGMARMIGLLYVALISEYGVTREEASLPFTVRNAVRYMAGPLAGALGGAFGVQAVTFWGGVVAALGSALCSLAPSVQWIVFFWGGIHGLGFALANTLFQVVINQWFDRHRASASGLVLSGACVGSLVLPLLIENVLELYGTSGCFLLLAGLFLHVLPPALVLMAPPWVAKPEAYARQRARYYEQLADASSMKDESCERNPSQIIHCTRASLRTRNEQTGLFTSRSHDEKHNKLSQSKTDKHANSGAICTLYRSMDMEDQFYYDTNGVVQNGISNPAFFSEKETSKRNSKETTIPVPIMKNSINSRFLQNLCNIPGLYLNPVYVLISVSLAAYFLLFLPVLTVIVDYPRDKGIPAGQEKFLIHALTIGDLFGRLAFGWITDRKILTLPIFMMISFVLQGVFVGLLPLAQSLSTCVASVGLYGVAAGIIFVHFPVLVHKYVDEKDQSIGIGCVGLVSSAATFGIPPLIGYFRDNIGSYDGLFYIIAVCSIVNGVLWLFVPLYEKLKEKA